MRFVLFVEGHTEDIALPAFLKRWLDPRLGQPVGIRTVRFDGWPTLLKNAPLKANMHLNGPAKDDIVAVISLLDLYGPTFYPSNLIASDARCTWATAHIEGLVNHPRFFQFFAVHEVEAWLLSDPKIFPTEVKKSLSTKANHPEAVNFDEPPAKLLERLYSTNTKRSYKKVVNGRELFGRLDPEVAYRQCPNLKKMLDKMLELAQSTLPS
jgi:hypothetical protein